MFVLIVGRPDSIFMQLRLLISMCVWMGGEGSNALILENIAPNQANLRA